MSNCSIFPSSSEAIPEDLWLLTTYQEDLLHLTEEQHLVRASTASYLGGRMD